MKDNLGVMRLSLIGEILIRDGMNNFRENSKQVKGVIELPKKQVPMVKNNYTRRLQKMSTRLKKMGLVVVVGVIMNFLLVTTPVAAKTTIDFYEYVVVEATKTLTKKAITEFEAQHPNIKINAMYHDWGSHIPKLMALAAAGKPPEVAHVDWDMAVSFYLNDILTPLDSYIERDRINLDDFYSYLDIKDKIYGLPYTISTMVVYLNMDLLQKAGFKYPAENWTRGDALEMARKMSKDTNGDGKIDQWGIDFGLSRAPANGAYWSLWNIWSFGGTGITNDSWTKCTLDEPEAIESYRWFTDLIFKYKVAPAAGQIGARIDPFDTAEVAMEIFGSWKFSGLERYDFSKDVAPLFVNPEGERYIQTAEGYYSLLKGCAHPEEGWKFLKFLTAESKDIQMIETAARKSVLMTDWVEKYQSHFPHLASAIKTTFESIRSHMIGPKYNEFLNALSQPLTLIFIGEISPEEVCKKATVTGDKVLKSAGAEYPGFFGK